MRTFSSELKGARVTDIYNIDFILVNISRVGAIADGCPL